ncbi:MAG: hypothetical protein A2219_00165 [Elusimicrobia bacterium RIFOXYA2_FULL_50_26]|nr:MAG: hypothetical protein A2219_00165 [Elusimicrobia bacterium RIFOXYA2_FULL_50_26]OGS24350.1 MAG: hypothetical protein A2314_03360 [Elusimicrobia bacterium RIFOXYB2_FULL_50_12]
MQRDIYKKLILWKNSKDRKPLLLQGARQTGKTYILKEFGKNEYEHLIYCNFEEDPGLEEFFRGNIDPHRIIEMLSLYKKQPVRPGADLIFFDEIQLSNNALNALKYFNEEAPLYHVVAAGSLLGVKLSVPKSFPVGKVTMLTLYPMTFHEFLPAAGEARYRELLENISEIEPLPVPIHEELITLLKKYYFVGGMPEAVAHYSRSGSLEEVRVIQDDIIKSYALDFAKHAAVSDIPKLSLIWDSIPVHLARENKKFIFSAISKSARAREYESALKWLQDAGLIHLAYAVETIQQPLNGFLDRSTFKVYAADVGLLGAMARIQPDILTQKHDLFTTYNGAFVENFTAQQLVASLQPHLYYWKSESKKAEVDFLYEHSASIFPLEVKAGVNPKSKSLLSYDRHFHPKLLIRATLLNIKLHKHILDIPLYAINCLDKFTQQSRLKNSD